MGAARVAVVFGARGTLGSALVPALERAGWRVAAPARAACDITDAGAVRALVTASRPSVVFNLAAFNDVDRSEGEPGLAYAVNATGAGLVAEAAASAGAAVVHYSTDLVFDGARAQPSDERDPPAPLSNYGRSKAAGDRLIAEANRRHFILRVGHLYGRGGRNFPSQIVPKLRAGRTIRVDRERMVSPTWVREVAAISVALSETEHHGLYHCTARGETTWADFARAAAGVLGVSPDLVQPVASGELPFPQLRPRRSILDNRALRAIGLDALSTWQDGLAAYLREEATTG